MTHRIGAALVRYEGAEYGKLIDSAAIVQERRLKFEVTVMMRDLGWNFGGEASGGTPRGLCNDRVGARGADGLSSTRVREDLPGARTLPEARQTGRHVDLRNHVCDVHGRSRTIDAGQLSIAYARARSGTGWRHRGRGRADALHLRFRRADPTSQRQCVSTSGDEFNEQCDLRQRHRLHTGRGQRNSRTRTNWSDRGRSLSRNRIYIRRHRNGDSKWGQCANRTNQLRHRARGQRLASVFAAYSLPPIRRHATAPRTQQCSRAGGAPVGKPDNCLAPRPASRRAPECH